MVLDDARQAVDRLAESRRGRNAIRCLLDWLDDDGLGLDNENQRAVVTILQACWGAWPGSTREYMNDAIAETRAAS